MCIKSLGLPHLIELVSKHPRDFFHAGRLKVMLFDENGTPLVASIPTKKFLFDKIAELIPEM